MQTGAIGYLRGDFDSSGAGFHTTWFDEVGSRNTEEFKAEIHPVIDALRFDEKYGGVLAGRSAMQKYGRSQPGSAFEGTTPQNMGSVLTPGNSPTCCGAFRSRGITIFIAGALKQSGLTAI